MSCLSLNLFSRINVPSSFTPRHRTCLPLGHSSTFPSGGLSTGVTSRSPGSAPTSKAGLPWPRHVLAYAVPRSRSPFFQSFDYQNSILPPTSLLLSGLRDTVLRGLTNFLPLTLLLLFLISVLGSPLRERHRDFRRTPGPDRCTASPVISTPHQMVCLLQSRDLRRHIITARSPRLPLGFTAGVVHSMGLDRCTMTVVHY